MFARDIARETASLGECPRECRETLGTMLCIIWENAREHALQNACEKSRDSVGEIARENARDGARKNAYG